MLRFLTEVLMAGFMGLVTLPAAALWAFLCAPPVPDTVVARWSALLGHDPMIQGAAVAAGVLAGWGMWFLFDLHWFLEGRGRNFLPNPGRDFDEHGEPR